MTRFRALLTALLLTGLAAATDDHVVLSLEQFERDAQPALDDYLAGRIDEAAFLAKARPWGNYREAYRPLIEFCKARGLPVVAAIWLKRVRIRPSGSTRGR